LNDKPNKKTKFLDLGLIDYKQAWDYQTNLFQAILDVKATNRNQSDNQLPTSNYLLFCEHPNVYTLGKSGDERNLLIRKEDLPSIDATYYHINRGGDITYHGPGQLVVYPVLDLENFFTDIHQYMRMLEETVIQTLAEFDIAAGRMAGMTGVWLDAGLTNARKICALGVKTSRWVTLHGLAYNVNTNLDYFKYIVPCGIADKAVTSMERELGEAQDMNTIKSILKDKLSAQFGMEIIN
jgi:lipoyl(octanoyl) transferase